MRLQKLIFVLSFAIFAFGILFFSASGASAEAPPPDVCAGEQIPEGHKGAIFALTDFRDLRVLQDPPNASIREWFCIPVSQAATHVDFESLVARSPQFLSRDAARRYAVTYYSVRSGDMVSRILGVDTAANTRYRLQRGAQVEDRFNRYLYLINTGEGVNFYLYFMQFFGEIKLSPKDIEWSVDKNLTVNHGEALTIVVSARAKDQADGDVIVACQTCASAGDAITTAGGTNQLTLVFDSKKLVDRFGLNVPGTYKFKVRGTTSVPPDIKYGEQEYVIQIGGFNCSQFNHNQVSCVGNSKCFWFAPDNQCASRRDPTICPKLSQVLCGKLSDGRVVGSEICQWVTSPDGTINQCVGPTVSSTIDQFSKPEGYQGPIPDCAWSGSCRDVNALLQVLLNYGQKIFSMIGMLAFVMFIIGGFMMIFSMGSPDRVKKGRDILVAAVVGMIIVFSAYILVNFLLDALQVGEGFRAIQ